MKKYTVKTDNNGDKLWFLNGKLHREDGPAVELANGDKSWYLDGYKYTKEDWEKEVARPNKSSSLDGKLVEIDGKKYKLVLDGPSETDKKIETALSKLTAEEKKLLGLV